MKCFIVRKYWKVKHLGCCAEDVSEFNMGAGSNVAEEYCTPTPGMG